MTLTSADARDRARRALDDWYRALHTDLATLCGDVGVDGRDRAVVFTAGIAETLDAYELELQKVSFVGLTNEVILEPTHIAGTRRESEWGRAVELWIEVRDCLSMRYGTEAGGGLIIDLDERAVGTWCSEHCPGDPDRYTPLTAELVADNEEDPAGPVDPFEALLVEESDAADADDRLVYLIDLHDLELPTVPHAESH